VHRVDHVGHTIRTTEKARICSIQAGKGIALDPAGSFSLAKWYLDCVTDAGEAVIVYATELGWHGARLHLTSVLRGAEGDVRTQTSMAQCRITQAHGRISAEAQKEGVAGVWLADGVGCERTIYETEVGRVQWKCLQPKSKVHLRVDDCVKMGLGYAECLILTVPPWKLPLNELRWGRFVSARDSLVWVDWKGTYSTRFALLNGETCQLTHATNYEVLAGPAKLRIHAGFALRKGRLKRTILPEVPMLKKLLPDSLFRVEEAKWCSRGEMSCEDRISTGWVIHEVVHWKT
jgi:hypothetical protein